MTRLCFYINMKSLQKSRFNKLGSFAMPTLLPRQLIRVSSISSEFEKSLLFNLVQPEVLDKMCPVPL